jgi:hypothetical protein
VRPFVVALLLVLLAACSKQELPSRRPPDFGVKLRAHGTAIGINHRFELSGNRLTFDHGSGGKAIERILSDAELDRVYADARAVARERVRARRELVADALLIDLTLVGGDARYELDSARHEHGSPDLALYGTLRTLATP